jgi:hypothetical protein
MGHAGVLEKSSDVRNHLSTHSMWKRCCKQNGKKEGNKADESQLQHMTSRLLRDLSAGSAGTVIASAKQQRLSCSATWLAWLDTDGHLSTAGTQAKQAPVHASARSKSAPILYCTALALAPLRPRSQVQARSRCRHCLPYMAAPALRPHLHSPHSRYSTSCRCCLQPAAEPQSAPASQGNLRSCCLWPPGALSAHATSAARALAA